MRMTDSLIPASTFRSPFPSLRIFPRFCGGPCSSSLLPSWYNLRSSMNSWCFVLCGRKALSYPAPSSSASVGGAMHRQYSSGERESPWNTPLRSFTGICTAPFLVCTSTLVAQCGINRLIISSTLMGGPHGSQRLPKSSSTFLRLPTGVSGCQLKWAMPSGT